MNDVAEEIKNKINIVEFVGKRVNLKKAGRNYKGLCPFHQEKTPSFVVSPERQIWHCFGSCGTGGDVIGFLMKLDNLTFIEALKDLADMVGVKLSNEIMSDSNWERKEKLFEINRYSAKYYQYVLFKTKYGLKAMEYLTNRKLNEKIIQTFEIGYAPASWDSLLKYLLKKKFSLKEIASTGLMIQKNATTIYDRFRNRIMFPLHNVRGNIIGFSGRILDSKSSNAKYINTPETEVYHKRDHLYGVDKTKDAIRINDNAIIVEGEFDLITPYQNGVENIVAIKGSALTEGQLNIIGRFTKRLVLALDTDEAGFEAMKRGIDLAEKMDFELRVAEFSNGKDPDESISKDKVQFIKDLKNAKPLYDFIIDRANKKFPDKSSFHKKNIGNEVIPYIRLIRNPIVRSHYIRLLSGLLDVQEESIETLLRKAHIYTNLRVFSVKSKTQTIPRNELLEKHILSYILQHSNPINLINKLIDVLVPSLFSIPSYSSIFSYLVKFLSSTDNFEYQKFINVLPAQTQSVADELFLFASDLPQISDEGIIKLIYELNIFCIKQEIKEQSKQIEGGNDLKLGKLSENLKNMEKSFRKM